MGPSHERSRIVANLNMISNFVLVHYEACTRFVLGIQSSAPALSTTSTINEYAILTKGFTPMFFMKVTI